MRSRLLLITTRLSLASSFLHLNFYESVIENNGLFLSPKRKYNSNDLPSSEKKFFYATEANNSTATKGIIVVGGTIATARYYKRLSLK